MYVSKSLYIIAMNQNHVLVLGGSYFIGRCVTEALSAAPTPTGTPTIPTRFRPKPTTNPGHPAPSPFCARLIVPCTLPEARRYFPFHDYDNVLDVSSIHALYNIEETPFEEGLRQAYAWYLKHQGEIEFNPAMDEIENQYLSECL